MRPFACLAFFFLCFTMPLTAEEIARLRVDLDGDSRAEQVLFETRPTSDQEVRRAVLTISGSTYEAEYFAGDGNLPEVEILRLHSEGPGRHLMLTTCYPGECTYHVLAYHQRRLVRVLTFGEHHSFPPQPLGNGCLEIRTWDGFWIRGDRHCLSADGLSLVSLPNQSQYVGVGVAAGKDLVLESPECPARAVPEGLYVRIGKFDSSGNRYWLEAINGACGWLPAADLETPKLREIPWAG